MADDDRSPPFPVHAAGSDRPELPRVRIGYIPLADCGSLVMASELGFDLRHGVKIELRREASWAAVRDKLVAGELEMAQLLYGLVYGLQLGLSGLQREMAVLMGLNRNGQGITLSRALAAAGVVDGASLKRHLAAAPRRLRFAQTFPTGTHAMWLNYWLAAAGIHPLDDVAGVTVPPPRMAAHMAAGHIEGFCAGEPWNQLAVTDGTGVTAATSQSIWPEHPEKALGATAAFADAHPHTCRAVVMAVLEASRWIDDGDEHRLQTAKTIASYVGVDETALAPRLLGRYEDGLGRRWQDAAPLRFHAEGEVNFPWLSDGMWFMTQFKRWGFVREHPAYRTLAAKVQRIGPYREAAAALGVALPADALRTSRLFDGRVWDGRDPAAYADGSEIAARPLVDA